MINLVQIKQYVTEITLEKNRFFPIRQEGWIDVGFISKVKKLGQGVSEALEIEAALGSKAMPLREFLMVVLDCLEKIPHVLVEIACRRVAQ